MLFYHLADIHLGACPDRGHPWSQQRAQQIYDSFYKVLERAHEEQADFVFICGDLFHRQPLKRELKELDYYFAKAAPVKIVIIAGNHDYIRSKSPYLTWKWSDNVFWFTEPSCQMKIFEKQKLCVYGLSYHHYEIRAALYDDLMPEKRPEMTHILLAHGGDARHIPVDWNRLKTSGFDYIAFGHIHKPQIIEPGKLAYAGALEPVDKNDDGPHGYIRGTVIDHKVSLDFIPWARVSYITLKIKVHPKMTFGELKDQAAAQIQADGGRNIYRLMIEGSRDLDLTIDTDAFYNMENVVDVRDCTEVDYDFAGIHWNNKENIFGKYMDAVEQMNLDESMKKQVLYYGISALYQTGEKQ